jgi:hypothetical protein
MAVESGSIHGNGDVAPTTRLQGWTRLMTVWLTIYCILGWRLYIPRGAGEAVSIANALSALILIGGVVLDAELRADIVSSVRRLPWLAAFAGLWTVMSLAAPLAGFPLRTVFAASTPLAVATFGLAGAMIWRDGLISPETRLKALLTIAWVQFAVGMMQALWHSGILRLAPFGWLNAWDAAVTAAYGVEHYAGRSFGLYLNPNPYSLLGGLLLVLALCLPLSGKERLWLAIPSAGIVFLGASRGVIVALALVATPYVIRRLRTMGWRAALVTLGAVITGGALAHFVLTATSNELYARFIERWISTPALLTRGPTVDPNAIGRLDAWATALKYWLAHPLGTMGPPQMAVGTFLDNDLVALMVQGGVLLAVAYFAALYAGAHDRLTSPVAPTIVPLIGLLVLAGLSQNAIVFPPSIALVWSVLGSTGSRK